MGVDAYMEMGAYLGEYSTLGKLTKLVVSYKQKTK